MRDDEMLNRMYEKMNTAKSRIESETGITEGIESLLLLFIANYSFHNVELSPEVNTNICKAYEIFKEEMDKDVN